MDGAGGEKVPTGRGVASGRGSRTHTQTKENLRKHSKKQVTIASAEDAAVNSWNSVGHRRPILLRNTKQMNVFIYESKGTDDDQDADLTMLMSSAKVTHLMIDPCLSTYNCLIFKSISLFDGTFIKI